MSIPCVTTQRPEMTDALIELWAEKIVARGLETPALLFLECNKPLTSIFHTTTLLLEPVAAPLFGADRVYSLQSLLANRENIEKLMQRIEYLAENLEKPDNKGNTRA